MSTLALSWVKVLFGVRLFYMVALWLL